MRGLLLKDFYLIRKYCKGYAAVVILFLVVAFISPENPLFFFYPCVFSALISVTLIAYDEREKWTTYAGTLPVTKAQIVSSKYCISLISGGVVMALVAVGQAVSRIRNGSMGADYGIYLSIMICIIFLIPAFILPFVFRLGAEKGRIAYVAVLVAAAVCVGAFMGTRDIPLVSGLSVNTAWAVILPLASAAVYVISWLLTVRIYEKKEF